MHTTHDIAALIGSRICHDLISPIGAIGNGVELLEIGGQSGRSELSLIAHSVESASARIRFFRIAFGAAPEDQSVSTTELLSILSARARDGRFRYVWSETGPVPRPDARICLLMILCAEVALPIGGLIRLARHRHGWVLEAEASRIAPDPRLWDPMSRGLAPDRIEAAQVQFALLPAALGQLGLRLSVATGAERLTLSY